MDLTPEEAENHEEESESEKALAQAEEASESKKPGPLVAFILLGLLFALFLFGVFQQNPAHDRIAVGGYATIYVPELPHVWVARDPDAFDEMMEASVANDPVSLGGLALSGGIFKVENRTKVKVIGERTNRREVRILEGSQVGRSGWVPKEWVR